MNNLASPEPGHRHSPSFLFDHLFFRGGRFALLLLMAALAALPATVQPIHAQTARAAIQHALLQKMDRIEGLPAELREDPVRRRLRAALNRTMQQTPPAQAPTAKVTATEAPASIQFQNTVNQILAAATADEAKLTADDGADGDAFGWSVSIEGDRALVGAPFNADGLSAAYVFAFDGTSWTQQGKLTPSAPEIFDVFGWSVSIDGNRAIVGAPFGAAGNGAAYVFAYNGTAWTQQAMLTHAGGVGGDQLGQSVSLDGDRALVGAFGVNAFQGAAYVFAYNGAAWTEEATLVPGDIAPLDDVGVAVSLDGDRALVGADGEDDNGLSAGAAYVFAYNGTAWAEQAKLTASDGAAMDFFGQSVSLDGDRALIGATLDDGIGSAYIFAFNTTTWTQEAKLTPSDGEAGDDFGTTVALSGNQALIGSVGDDDNGPVSGSAYDFAFDGATWTQEAKRTASDGATFDFYGVSVSLDGDRSIIGAFLHAGNGAAYAFASDAGPEPPPHPFLFLADEKILLHGQRASVGDLYSNGEIEIRRGNPSTHVGSLTALGTINVATNNTIDGDATAGSTITLTGTATVTGVVTENAAVDPLPLPDLSFSAGGASVFVNKNQTLVLAPGTYADLKVDINGTLVVSSGEYFFTQAEFKQNAVLRTDVAGGPVTINVVGEIKFEKETEVDIVPQGEAGSPFVRINTLAGVIIKKDARIFGTIVAPEGTVTVDKEGFFQGLICAKRIEVKQDGTLLYHGASLPSMPASEQAAPTPVAQRPATTEAAPEAFRLASNYPNPFNPVTMIAFELPEAEPVRLVVYDVTGRVVARLLDGPMAAGTHWVRFDASGLPGGVYLYRLTAGPFTQTRRMVLVK